MPGLSDFAQDATQTLSGIFGKIALPQVSLPRLDPPGGGARLGPGAAPFSALPSGPGPLVNLPGLPAPPAVTRVAPQESPTTVTRADVPLGKSDPGYREPVDVRAEAQVTTQPEQAQTPDLLAAVTRLFALNQKNQKTPFDVYTGPDLVAELQKRLPPELRDLGQNVVLTNLLQALAIAPPDLSSTDVNNEIYNHLIGQNVGRLQGPSRPRGPAFSQSNHITPSDPTNFPWMTLNDTAPGSAAHELGHAASFGVNAAFGADPQSLFASQDRAAHMVPTDQGFSPGFLRDYFSSPQNAWTDLVRQSNLYDLFYGANPDYPGLPLVGSQRNPGELRTAVNEDPGSHATEIPSTALEFLSDVLHPGKTRGGGPFQAYRAASRGAPHEPFRGYDRVKGRAHYPVTEQDLQAIREVAQNLITNVADVVTSGWRAGVPPEAAAVFGVPNTGPLPGTGP